MRVGAHVWVWAAVDSRVRAKTVVARVSVVSVRSRPGWRGGGGSPVGRFRASPA